jgi:hypothetical protein
MNHFARRDVLWKRTFYITNGIWTFVINFYLIFNLKARLNSTFKSKLMFSAAKVWRHARKTLGSNQSSRMAFGTRLLATC